MATTKFIPGTVVASSWTNDVDRQTYTTLSGVSGTNTLVGVGPNSITTLTTGQVFYFNPQTTNSGPATINITCNGVALGAKNIIKFNGIPLVAQDLVAGCEAMLYYDGVSFQLVNPQTPSSSATGRLLGVQRFVSNGTYTPTTGTTSIIAHVVGGGGGGGGTLATAAGQVAGGGGGGSGAYSVGRFTTGFSGAAVTVGAAGIGVAAAAGTSGTQSSLGALITAPGGTGGLIGGNGVVSASISGPGGVAGTGGNILQLPGIIGHTPLINSFTNTVVVLAPGGPSPLGGGGGYNSNGFTATASAGGAAPTGSYGAGGGGSAANASQAVTGGAVGMTGVVIIYEYA